MLCGGPKSLPVFHHGVDYIFWPFGINELMFVCFKQTNNFNPKFENSRLGLIRVCL